ncbi:Plastid-lipid associated protein PAP / fibrillin family protein [Hibiscus syriacus]|uniref:Plastid-lipid associated protein PAP / fibrillin family protein n=2 Tax=Hibiscus syriacus TaxID=106335 RepID=A0A6A2YW11_HIBSY|nr:Plastid-lipid associated protein PAP / fibrillin family protein [Hibiscus syriacus]
MRNQTRTSPSPLSLHKDSQTISKSKPKIRIIHVFAPEIIKTDVANFRELVQRLTGKPPQEKGSQRKPAMAAKKKMELRTGFLAGFEWFKEEGERFWSVSRENSGGFLSGFGDFDGLIQELGKQFPLLPLDASHHTHGFEEAQPIA